MGEIGFNLSLRDTTEDGGNFHEEEIDRQSNGWMDCKREMEREREEEEEEEEDRREAKEQEKGDVREG